MASLVNKLLKNVLLFVVPYVLYTFYIDREEHLEQVNSIQIEIPKNEKQIKREEAKIKQVAKFKENLDVSEKRVGEVASQISKIQQKLPNDVNETEILDIFSQEAKLVNIKEVFLTPKGEVNKGFYFAKEFQLKGLGTFLQFLIFFERISSNERILNIKSMTMVTSQKKRKGRYKLVKVDTVMEAYRYNTGHKVDTAIQVKKK